MNQMVMARLREVLAGDDAGGAGAGAGESAIRCWAWRRKSGVWQWSRSGRVS